jgi:hypothetical protein
MPRFADFARQLDADASGMGRRLNGTGHVLTATHWGFHHAMALWTLGYVHGSAIWLFDDVMHERLAALAARHLTNAHAAFGAGVKCHGTLLGWGSPKFNHIGRTLPHGRCPKADVDRCRQREPIRGLEVAF